MGPNRRLWIVIAATLAAVALVVLPRACGDNATDTADPAPAETPATDTTVPAGPTTTAAPGSPAPTEIPAATLSDPAATGRELTQRFLDILTQADPVPQLEEFLSPAFQLQRSNGTFVNRDEYLQAPASVSRYTISDENFRAYADGPVLTVRFTVEITETIEGAEVRVTTADRLGVFVQSAAGWQLVAWSNFNPLPAES